MPTLSDSLLMSTREVAARLNVTPQTVSRWVTEGFIPAHCIARGGKGKGKRLKFWRKAVEALGENLTQGKAE